MKNKNLSEEVIDFNRRISCIISASTIDVRNKAAFIAYVKNHSNNQSLKLPVLIYLCDNRYIFQYIKHSEKIFNGETARYVILKMDLDKLTSMINTIKKRNNDRGIRNKKISQLVRQFHNKCNNYVYADTTKSINLFIKKNIMNGAINKENCFEKMSDGRNSYETYIKKEMKNILGWFDDDLINTVDFISKFYNSLKRVMEDEFTDESINILTSYLLGESDN